MTSDLNFDTLTDSEKVLVLQEQLKGERRSRREAEERCSIIVKGTTPSQYASVNAAQVATLERDLAKADEDVADAKRQCHRSCGANSALVALSEAQKRRNQLAIELAKYKPAAAVSEAVTRTRAEQLEIDRLEREVENKKREVATRGGSNASLVALNSALENLKKYKTELDRKHQRKIADAEAARRLQFTS